MSAQVEVRTIFGANGTIASAINGGVQTVAASSRSKEWRRRCLACGIAIKWSTARPGFVVILMKHDFAW
jgi:hypothetical protein